MFSSQLKLLGLHIPAWTIPSLGWAISIGSLIWVFHGVDFETLWQDYGSLAWAWIPVAVFTDLFVYFWQSYRWNLLLAPVKKIPIWRSVRAIYVGLFANEILPMRTGEVLRTYLQTRWSEIPFSVVFSSVIIERFFDGIWLMLAFFLATLVVPMPVYVVVAGKIMAGFVVLVAILLVAVMLWKHYVHAAVAKTRWGAKLQVLVHELHSMGRSRSFYAGFAASLPYLLLQVIPIWALMRAYKLDLSIWAAMVVLLVIRIGTVIPQAPGNIGVLQAMTELGLSLFGVDKTTSAGFSAIVWIVITMPLLIAGSIALVVTGIRFKELHKDAAKLTPVIAGDRSAA